MSSSYHPEVYWSEVARRIKNRKGHNVLAGDDSPYYRYKRTKFLALIDEVGWGNQRVMELGSGPGGNLAKILTKKPLQLVGVDISEEMINIASENLESPILSFYKTDGKTIPLSDQCFDLVFSATVLQHNTDEEMMKDILREMCRVSDNKVYLFERIENRLTGDELCMGRPIEYYKRICNAEGFELRSVSFINIQTSYWVCGIIRNTFNRSSRKEGEMESRLSSRIQSVLLPITSILDKIFPAKRDLARLEFVRTT